MNVRNAYITKDEFEAYLENGRFYEGFVIGVGYAYVETKPIQPPHFNGYSHVIGAGYGHADQNHFSLISFQCLDTSPEMVLRSNEAAVTGSFILYKVARGESLWSIADRFGVTADDIARWNGISVTDTIHPEEVLVVDDRAKVQKDTGSIGDVVSDSSGSFGVVLDMSFSVASVAIASKLAMENYSYLSQLARNGQFMGMKNGGLIVMDNSFLGTPRMAAVRGAEKADFLSKVNKLGWLKKLGLIGGVLTTGSSIYRFTNAETTEEKLEHGTDAIAGIVGFMGPWGAFISGNYFLGKAMHPYAVEHEVERAERISRGDYSMALWKFGRGIR